MGGCPILSEQVKEYLKEKMKRLEKLQNPDGSWSFIFEGPIMPDCFLLIVMRALGMEDEETEAKLLQRIVSLQEANGSFQLYKDEENGNLSATIQGYTAMLLSGKFQREHERMKKAERYINREGGLSKAHFMTKMMLAVNGLYEYPAILKFPMTYFLMPSWFPLSMYRCSNYARVHLTPMIVCLNKRYSVHHPVDTAFFDEGDNDSWLREDRGEWTESVKEELKRLALTPLQLHEAGETAAKQFMLTRIEENGTLYSYLSATFYMVYALLALGYSKSSPLLKKAVKGMQSYMAETENGWHAQNSPSEVWDTALLSYSLQEAGMAETHPVIRKANGYLLQKQQSTRGDWTVNAPRVDAGGWGFSDSNHWIPDNDDTSAALRALARISAGSDKVRSAWEKGLRYLLSMQNRDGGWGAFEKNAYHPIFRHLPIDNAKDAMIDDSTADLTGRVLECLGNYAGYDLTRRRVKRAVQWLVEHQKEDGSWYGKWGICYIYGTWAALTGLSAVGFSRESQAFGKAVEWLESIQNKDGGWGESCRSAEEGTYIPGPFSTPSQTAWALDALLTVRQPEARSVQRAVSYLASTGSQAGDALRYPTGLGLPGGFYIHYGSYNELFPMLALGHYLKKLEGGTSS